MTTPKAPADGFSALDACHRQTLEALAKLAGLVTLLEADQVDAATRSLAGDIVRHFSTTSRQHHQDEERHVFPALLASGDALLVQTAQRLQQDHGWLEEDWLEISPHIDAVAGGRSGCDIDLLREGAAIFGALAQDHIALEESILYPAARASLRPDERREMGREMAARRRKGRAAGGAGRTG